MVKTDRLDTQVVAHFEEAVRPPMRPLRDDDTQGLGRAGARNLEVNDLNTYLRRRIQYSPIWREKDDLLRSVPGVNRRCRRHYSRICRRWSRSTAGRSPPWSVWRP